MKLENLKRLFTDEDAVSPVIGVILMVAITVILAAIIGTFVLGLGEKTGDTAPQASFSYAYDDANGDLTVTHDGGDAITDTDLNITAADGSPTEMQWGSTGSKVTAGDSVTFGGGTNVDTSDTVRVVWTGDNGDSATLAKWTGPDA